MIKIALALFLLLFSFQISANDRVEEQVNFWQTTKILKPSIKRASLYIGIVTPIIQKCGLPEKLALLPILESGYRCGAKSKAGALGCWQFMSKTGVEYGLKKTVWNDTRGNITKSTKAACKYLKRLYGRYNNWELALAAYNYGEGRLDKAMKKEGVQDFWELKTIPKETRNYVPKFLALVEMGILKQIRKSELIQIKIKGVQPFSRIAGILRIKTKYLSDINPSYATGNTPPGITIIYLSPAWNRSGLCSIGIADCN